MDLLCILPSEICNYIQNYVHGQIKVDNKAKFEEVLKELVEKLKQPFITTPTEFPTFKARNSIAEKVFYTQSKILLQQYWNRSDFPTEDEKCEIVQKRVAQLMILAVEFFNIRTITQMNKLGVHRYGSV